MLLDLANNTNRKPVPDRRSRIAKVSERLDETSQRTQVRDFKDAVCDLVLSNQSSQSRIDAEQFGLIYFHKISGPRSPVFYSKPYYWPFNEEAQYVVQNFIWGVRSKVEFGCAFVHFLKSQIYLDY